MQNGPIGSSSLDNLREAPKPKHIKGLSDYFCFVLVKDGKDTIDATLSSIVWQTHAPHKLIIIDDGSTDGTSESIDAYVREFPEMIYTVNTHSKTRDYRRLVKLWNLSMHLADMTGPSHQDAFCKEKHPDESCSVHCRYHMISGGDSKYHPEYAERIVRFMDANRDYVVCSGDYDTAQAVAPHGAGRFVSQDFFYDNYRDYPEIIGYESEILLRAMFVGKKTKVLQDARYDHLDELGKHHNFVEFGQAMRALGYYWPYVFAKCAMEFCKSDGQIGPHGALNILKSYLTFKPRVMPRAEVVNYYTYFPEDFRRQVRQFQKKAMVDRLRKVFSH